MPISNQYSWTGKALIFFFLSIIFWIKSGMSIFPSLNRSKKLGSIARYLIKRIFFGDLGTFSRGFFSFVYSVIGGFFMFVFFPRGAFLGRGLSRGNTVYGNLQVFPTPNLITLQKSQISLTQIRWQSPRGRGSTWRRIRGRAKSNGGDPQTTASHHIQGDRSDTSLKSPSHEDSAQKMKKLQLREVM